MNIKKYYHYILWLACTVIVLIPLITKNHIYIMITQTPGRTMDFINYVVIVETITNGDIPYPIIHPAQLYFGKFLALIVNTFSVDTINLVIIFYFVLLFLTIVVIYLIVSNVTNKHNGWIAVGLIVLCTTGIMGLFTYGIVFNIVNIYIFLLSAILFASKWLSVGKWYNLVFSLAFLALYSVSHLTSLYAPYSLLVIIGGIGLIKVIKRGSVSIKKPLVLWSLAVAVNIGLSYIAFPIHLPLMNNITANNAAAIAGFGSVSQLGQMPLTIGYFISDLLSLTTTTILILVIAAAWKYRKQIKYSKQTKYMLAILGGFIVALGIGSFTVLSPEPMRTGIDMATLLAITIAIMLGSMKVYWVNCASVMLIGIYSIITIISWVR